MAGRVFWRRAAEDDLVTACRFLAEDSTFAAERLLDAVEGGVRFLLDHPRAGRRREFRTSRAQGVRSWTLRGSPAYLLFSRVEGDDLDVVRLLHGARDLPSLMEDEE